MSFLANSKSPVISAMASSSSMVAKAFWMTSPATFSAGCEVVGYQVNILFIFYYYHNQQFLLAILDMTESLICCDPSHPNGSKYMYSFYFTDMKLSITRILAYLYLFIHTYLQPFNNINQYSLQLTVNYLYKHRRLATKNSQTPIQSFKDTAMVNKIFQTQWNVETKLSTPRGMRKTKLTYPEE